MNFPLVVGLDVILHSDKRMGFVTPEWLALRTDSDSI